MTETKSHQDWPRPTTLDTKPYQTDPSQVNSYVYQQTLPKNKEVFLWILHELDTLSRRSRPYYIKESIIPQEEEIHLPDPRYQNTIEESTCTSISSEIDHILNQEFEISTSLSELDLTFTQLQAEDVPPQKKGRPKPGQSLTLLEQLPWMNFRGDTPSKKS